MMRIEKLDQQPPCYPFSAIVEQHQAKRALLLYAVNPAIGGILLIGSVGTGKSQLLHAGASLIHDRQCISIPVHVTQDRLHGSIDISAAMDRGKVARVPGLLEQATDQLLLVDYMNLVPGALMKGIVNEQSSGPGNRFMLLAAMDSDDNASTPALVDHFGLCVALETLNDLNHRVEIIHRRLEFERDAHHFYHQYQAAEEALRQQIETARKTLMDIKVSNEMIQLVSSTVHEAGIVSARADLSLIEASKAAAAWAGRDHVTLEDIRETARLVLPHRMDHPVEHNYCSGTPIKPDANKRTTPPSDYINSADSSSDDLAQTDRDTNMNKPENSTHRKGFADEQANDSLHENSGNAVEEGVQLPDELFLIEPLKIHSKNKLDHKGVGKRNEFRSVQEKGRAAGARLPNRKHWSDVAFDATIRAAAPYQTIRTKRNGLAFTIEMEDLRLRRRENRVGATLLFVVDASGSMAARQRMATVKGGILSLLQDAYVKRDRLGMIIFRKNNAELILPVTRSVDSASKQLKDIPTGGKTPLAAGLIESYKVIQAEKRRNNETVPIIILVTDGKANYSASGLKANSDIWNECLEAARGIRHAKIPCLVLDTEQGYVKLGRSKQLAEAMGADYRKLDLLKEDDLVHAVRTMRE